jgi:Leucine-rich repeat (LRR) protein
VELAVCAGLTRLDLSKNKLTSLDGVAMNTALRWLSVAGNAIDSADALKDLEHLEVLNLGRNQLAGKVAVGRLRALKALIANENQITLVGGKYLRDEHLCRAPDTLQLSACVAAPAPCLASRGLM